MNYRVIVPVYTVDVHISSLSFFSKYLQVFHPVGKDGVLLETEI